MRTLVGFTFGVVATLLGVSTLAPGQTEIQVVHQVDDTVHINQVITTLDLEQLRDIDQIDPDLNEALAAECAYAIQRQTDEPLKGIVIQVERWWQGDSCAAYEHLVRHGWY
jgi:hypothetical protein